MIGEYYNIEKWITPISNIKEQKIKVKKVRLNSRTGKKEEYLSWWSIEKIVLKENYTDEMVTNSLGHEMWRVHKPFSIVRLVETLPWDEYLEGIHEEKYKYEDRIWMSDSPGEYFSMLDLINRIMPKYDSNNNIKKQNILVGGLGLGLIIHLLKLRNDIDKIFVIEKNKHIINMVWPYTSSFYPDKSVKIRHSDFLEIELTLEKEIIDIIDVVIVDIWKSNKDIEDKKLFNDCKNVVETVFPEAQHLYWLFQNKIEYSKYKLRKW